MMRRIERPEYGLQTAVGYQCQFEVDYPKPARFYSDIPGMQDFGPSTWPVFHPDGTYAGPLPHCAHNHKGKTDGVSERSSSIRLRTRHILRSCASSSLSGGGGGGGSSAAGGSSGCGFSSGTASTSGVGLTSPVSGSDMEVRDFSNSSTMVAGTELDPFISCSAANL